MAPKKKPWARYRPGRPPINRAMDAVADFMRPFPPSSYDSVFGGSPVSQVVPFRPRPPALMPPPAQYALPPASVVEGPPVAPPPNGLMSPAQSFAPGPMSEMAPPAYRERTVGEFGAQIAEDMAPLRQRVQAPLPPDVPYAAPWERRRAYLDEGPAARHNAPGQGYGMSEAGAQAGITGAYEAQVAAEAERVRLAQEEQQRIRMGTGGAFGTHGGLQPRKDFRRDVMPGIVAAGGPTRSPEQEYVERKRAFLAGEPGAVDPGAWRGSPGEVSLGTGVHRTSSGQVVANARPAAAGLAARKAAVADRGRTVAAQRRARIAYRARVAAARRMGMPYGQTPYTGAEFTTREELLANNQALQNQAAAMDRAFRARGGAALGQR